ncbi:hypothetical protein N8I74_04900 [Chitiniphilus purpureus]|uniref:Uncharacterized protein n=1 Tax=Chitiniphilus purpureus TaxID=2981137 RepID=A0ABY6DSA9_9NEIS|nr:hypothetical protein [Chitiniphilus sp. CD1]UXY16361.1 hypothetical protein N8I74_04900 [Chitiniphilus sp. CD1]
MVKRVRLQLGDTLVQRGIITDNERILALGGQWPTRCRLGKVLIAQGRPIGQGVGRLLPLRSSAAVAPGCSGQFSCAMPRAPVPATALRLPATGDAGLTVTIDAETGHVH